VHMNYTCNEGIARAMRTRTGWTPSEIFSIERSPPSVTLGTFQGTTFAYTIVRLS